MDECNLEAVAICLGLVLEVAGVMLLAREVWGMIRRTLDSPKSLREITRDVALASLKKGKDRAEAVDGVCQRISELGMHERASASLDDDRTVRLRVCGTVGLLLIFLGFALQFWGTIQGIR